MDINFTGMKNINIKMFETKGYGHYLSNSNNVVQGDKYYTVVSLRADLDTKPIKGEDTNAQDFQSHLHQYFSALQKLKNIEHSQRILDINEPNNIEIVMKHFYAPDELGEVNQASFMINGEDITLTNRDTLPLYTFMARVTRDLLKFFRMDPKIKESVELMNNSISKEAEEFIENMNL